MADRNILTHHDLTLRPDPSRTLLRPFDPSYPESFAKALGSRAERIVRDLLEMDRAEMRRILALATKGLGERHRDLDATLVARFDEVRGACGGREVDGERARLIGLYFLEEYSFEAAALFNPSIVPLPPRPGDGGREVRFALSLRGVGEGHISSVTFRTGRWTPGEPPTIDAPSAHAASPLIEGSRDEGSVVTLRWEGIESVSEAALFPVLDRHRQGIEDARFVRFVEEDGAETYYATVTGFDGKATRGELIRARSLDAFELHPLEGRAAGNKGMALFPRRVNGRYAMLGRQDNEKLWLLYSDDLFRWDEAEELLAPKWAWEVVQMGNCGSPIEIDEGWLVLTHGVGPARAYSVGACLLDKADPSRVLGRTPVPLIHPSEQERDGYVPNVVYSCGGLVADRTLLLPYGVADSETRFATGSVHDILAAMR